MLPRRLRAILQVPSARRIGVLAEGARLLADNAAALEADAVVLGADGRGRGAALLRTFADEEAAKVLILLDLVRAGWADQQAVSACLSRFYDHLARGLYVRAYEGNPADIAEVRGYVDGLRQQYFLDGPMDFDWIFGNEVRTGREERLYVDYVEDENGGRRWTGPAERTAAFDAPFASPAPASTAVRVVAGMESIGLLTEQGLGATRAVWDGTLVDDTMHFSDLRPLNVAVVRRLASLNRREYGTDHEQAALGLVVDRWSFPMTGLDLSEAKVRLEDLRAERTRRLVEEMGVDDGHGDWF